MDVTRSIDAVLTDDEVRGTKFLVDSFRIG
jgi:hypothetical protein